jgi:hypothetical protein
MNQIHNVFQAKKILHLSLSLYRESFDGTVFLCPTRTSCSTCMQQQEEEEEEEEEEEKKKRKKDLSSLHSYIFKGVN